MEFNTIVLGIIALIMWSFIWLHASRGPLGWISPISLFAMGVLIFYIIPPLYWQFRPWNYWVPPYFEGLPLVLIGAIVLGLPFMFVKLRRARHGKVSCEIMDFQVGRFGSGLWLCVLPVLAGLGWKIHLLILGYQSRLARTAPVLFGSKSLAFLIGNIGYYYFPFYFALAILGNKRQRWVGILLWICDGIFQMYTLHRHAMLFFVFRSLVFITILGFKMSRKQWVGMAFFGIFVIAIIGKTPHLAYQAVTIEMPYLTPVQVVQIVGKTTGSFLASGTNDEEFFLFKAVDDTMFRLYDARSASAVMMDVPNVIPYHYGVTFLQIFYAPIPRYFWPDKPSLGDIHMVTTLVMPDDSGINPTGTIAELYMNGNFIFVFFGGAICFMICRWIERVLLRKELNQYILLCVYPIMTQWIIGANYNLTQRLSEGLRIVIFIWLFWLFIRFIRGRWIVRFPNRVKAFSQGIVIPIGD
ncbi:MAG: hypothetical protein KAS99_02195 [Candidatus Omnitrophica bacterium]|nr:hypothetical protein [Candidatus Omnitrophota bacterium]